MKTYELMEYISVNELDVPDDIAWKLINEYSDSQWIRCTEIFLRGIGARHSINGSIIATLQGIMDWYREKQVLTNKQKFYIFYNILNNWNQIGIDMRSTLML